MRRLKFTAIVVLIAAGLGGCVGIPTSGSVQTGATIDEEVAPDVGYDPSGPQAGASPTEILTGFIQAATNPQDDYAVARQFLSPGIADTWEPNEITQIRSATGQALENADGTLSYTFSSSAYVDDAGRYTHSAQSTQRLPFSFAQNTSGEWRITSAPDGIVLSSEGFETIFDEHALYYFDPSYGYLVPDLRWFPRTTLLSTRLVTSLIAGQSSWLGQGVTINEFPTGTTLASRVTTDSGIATVDLSAEVLEASPESRARMSEQIKNTIGTVSSVVLTVNGVPIDVPDIEQAPIVDPTVQSQSLVRTEDAFGFINSAGEVSTLAGQSSEILDLGATAVTLAPGRELSAVLAADGVHVVFPTNSDERLLDARPGLADPSTDASRFVWSVPLADASAIRAYDAEGTAYPITSAIAPGTRVVSFAVSRDGTRLMLYSATDVGTELNVYGILRADGVPYGLGEPLTVDLDQLLVPVDAAWVDDRTIATLATQSSTGITTVTLHTLGGPSESFGRVTGGVAIVGGNGEDGLRVRTTEGDLYQPRGNSWADTGLRVSFIATQQ